jgi:HEAT repeat protein
MVESKTATRAWAATALLAALVSSPGCANHIGTTAASFLRRAQEDPSPDVRNLAYRKLANPNCFDNDSQRIEAVRVLGKALDERREPVVTRAVICRTLGEIGRPEAREPLLNAVNDNQALVRAAACRALGKVGTGEDAVTLAQVMAADHDPDCRIAAIEGIREIRQPDPRVYVVLVGGLENTDPAVRLSSYEALQTLSGQNLGPDAKAWRTWALAQNGGTPAGGTSQPSDAEVSRVAGPDLGLGLGLGEEAGPQ